MEKSTDIALLVIDMQKGLFQKSIPIHNADKLINNVCLLLDRAHQAEVPVFFIQHSTDKILPFGTDEWHLHPEIQPLEADHIIYKHHSSAFEETTLKQELDSLGIKRLVVTGLVTHGCVKAACLAAHELGYRVILVEDGHSNYSKDAERLINQWNEKLSQDIVELKPAQEVDF